MAYVHLKSPYSRSIDWSINSNYCNYAQTEACCDYTFDGNQLCCDPNGSSDCPYSSTSGVCSADHSVSSSIQQAHFQYYSNCVLDESCYHSELNGMFSEDALRNRYCDQCTRCGMELLPTQVTVEFSTYLLSGSAKVENEQGAWRNKFSCCACPVIQGGKTCAPNDDMYVTDTSVANAHFDTCDKIGQLPLTVISEYPVSSYNFKTMNSFYQGDNCLGNTLIDPEDMCQGWAVNFGRDGESEQKIGMFGIDCIKSTNQEKTYTTLDEPQTCKARYLSNPEIYMEATYGFENCYEASEFAERGCMTVEEMKTYSREFNENAWYASGDGSHKPLHVQVVHVPNNDDVPDSRSIIVTVAFACTAKQSKVTNVRTMLRETVPVDASISKCKELWKCLILATAMIL